MLFVSARGSGDCRTVGSAGVCALVAVINGSCEIGRHARTRMRMQKFEK
ncbi:hypothetical protein [Azospirillum doebereinerae]